MTNTRTTRTVATAAAGFLALVGLAAVGVPAASADDFDATNTAPTVSISVTPGPMQPAGPQSADTYTVTATIGDLDTLVNLNTVTMCWFASGASATCADAATDPKNQFKMVWTRSSDAFAVTGTNNYANVSSASGYGETAITMDTSFNFKVSSAMTKATDWSVTVTALDVAAATDSDTVASKTVLYYGAVTADRAGQDFGAIAALESALAENLSDGEFLANSASNVTMATSVFSNGTISLANAGGAVALPAATGPGKFALDCAPAATYAGGTPIRLAADAANFVTNQWATGTGETAVTGSLVNSCRLSYGGSPAVAGSTFTGTVTVGIGAAS